LAVVKVVDTIYRMCGRYCLINVHVKDGKLVKITGSPGHFLTNGKVCGKDIAELDILFHPL